MFESVGVPNSTDPKAPTDNRTSSLPAAFLEIDSRMNRDSSRVPQMADSKDLRWSSISRKICC